MEQGMKRFYIIVVLIGVIVFVAYNYYDDIIYSTKLSKIPKINLHRTLIAKGKLQTVYKEDGLGVIEWKRNGKVVRRDYIKNDKYVKSVDYSERGTNISYFGRDRLLKHESYYSNHVTATVTDYVMLTEVRYFDNGSIRQKSRLKYKKSDYGGRDYIYYGLMESYFDLDADKPVLKRKAHYRDNDFNETLYYKSGKVKEEGLMVFYEEGRNTLSTRMGKWSFYNEEGIKIKELICKKNLIYKEILFDNNGNVISNKILNHKQ